MSAPTFTVREPEKVIASFKALAESMRGMRTAFEGFSASFQSPANLCGYKVTPVNWLPAAAPSPAEDARRIVRHELAARLPWLRMGDVGPKPGERAHMVLIAANDTMFVSHELWDELCVTVHPIFGAPQPVKAAIYHARYRSNSEQWGGPAPAWVGMP